MQSKNFSLFNLTPAISGSEFLVGYNAGGSEIRLTVDSLLEKVKVNLDYQEGSSILRVPPFGNPVTLSSLNLNFNNFINNNITVNGTLSAASLVLGKSDLVSRVEFTNNTTTSFSPTARNDFLKVIVNGETRYIRLFDL